MEGIGKWVLEAGLLSLRLRLSLPLPLSLRGRVVDKGVLTYYQSYFEHIDVSKPVVG